MFDTVRNGLDRDTIGQCKGECRDRVREGEDERQQKINHEYVDAEAYSPSVPWAKSRDTQPGVFGGHV